jgi:hypothetical protein
LIGIFVSPFNTVTVFFIEIKAELAESQPVDLQTRALTVRDHQVLMVNALRRVAKYIVNDFGNIQIGHFILPFLLMAATKLVEAS